jgi:hypothetical protein
LNASPQRFDGQTVVVRASLSGTTVSGPRHCRLTVKDEGLTLDAGTLRGQGINIVIPAGKTVGSFMRGMKLGDLHPVRLTVEVWRGKGAKRAWLANVTAIEKENTARHSNREGKHRSLE